MDGTIFQSAALIVLGWLVLAAVVGAGLSVFLRAAHRLERQLPTERRAIRAWVRAGKRVPPARPTRRPNAA